MTQEQQTLPNPMLLLADKLAAIKDRLDAIADEESELKKEKEAVEKQLIDMMTAEEVEKFTRNGRTFFPQVKTNVSIKADEKEAAHAWLKENGFGDLVKEQVNAQSLTSWYKEMTEQGELPEDFASMLNVFEKITIGMRKGRS
jgi:hypothetical protein